MRAIENWIGMFAVSRAGHDKNNIYIIIEETEQDVLLADGELKGIEHLKRKNKKHIQIIKKDCNPEIREKLLQAEAAVSNEEIKRAIKLYKNSGRMQEGAR